MATPNTLEEFMDLHTEMFEDLDKLPEPFRTFARQNYVDNLKIPDGLILETYTTPGGWGVVTKSAPIPPSSFPYPDLVIDAEKTPTLECLVCKQDEKLRYLPCKHYYCQECIPKLWKKFPIPHLGSVFGLECAFCRSRWVLEYVHNRQHYDKEEIPDLDFPLLPSDFNKENWFKSPVCNFCTGLCAGSYAKKGDVIHYRLVHQSSCACDFPVCGRTGGFELTPSPFEKCAMHIVEQFRKGTNCRMPFDDDLFDLMRKYSVKLSFEGKVD